MRRAKTAFSAAIIAQLEDAQQLGNRELFLLSPRVEHLGDMGAQMILDEQLVQAAQRLLDRKRLRDYVDAIVFVVDHLLQSAHLALENATAMECTFLQVFNHSAIVPLGGTDSRENVSPRGRTVLRMRVTKQEHACLLIEDLGATLVIDPGVFTAALVGLSAVVAIVITHEHGDHWTDEQLTHILDRNPDAQIFGPAGVVAAASGFPITAVKHGDTIEVAPFSLRFFGEDHAVIHESIPLVDNVGVLVNDALYYPGDSYTVPDDAPVAVLAAPVGAPWLKIGEAMDFVLAVKPRRAFATHEMTLSVAGKTMGNDRLGWATRQGGGEYFALEPGESLEL